MGHEHMLPQSTHPEAANDYENCVYACQYCNRSRSNSEASTQGGPQLLDPTRVAWADHFRIDGDQLACRPDDVDALYTRSAYDLNDGLKVKLRARRARLMKDWLVPIRDLPPRIDKLHQIAVNLSGAQRQEILDVIQNYAGQIQRARRNLLDYAGIPYDCDPACRCRSRENHCLPGWLEEQLVQVSA